MPLIFLLVPVGILVALLALPSPAPEILFLKPWVPELGINFSFSLTALSLFMGLLITAIGSFITFYAVFYMKEDQDKYRFWTFFLIFMISMLGLVFSDNLITAFLFWEATSICSYFLIGHYYRNEEARKSAMTSLLTTGGGGICLLVGFIGLGSLAGTYEISELILHKDQLLSHPYLALPLGAILIGVMTKSAQFPFHFWLPQAMAGPAPVSAFLHSATMVKAGIFLIAKLFPLFSVFPLWEPVLTGVGLITFLWGGGVAIRHFDLKSILANTTISALGCLVALLGMAQSYPKALEAFLLFFIAHALYKAALFLCAGILEKKYATKDIREIRTTLSHDPLLAGALIVGALSMMGLPPTVGFVAKESFLEFSTDHWFYASGLLLGSLLNFVAAGKILYHLFLSPAAASKVHIRSTSLLSSAPFALGVFTLALPLLGPAFLNSFIERFVSEMGSSLESVQVSLWHGFTPALLLSTVTIVTGSIIVWATRRSAKGIEDELLSPLAPTNLYNSFMGFLNRTGSLITQSYQSGYLRRYFLMMFSASTVLVLLSIAYLKPKVGLVASPVYFLEICIGLILVFSTIATVVTESKIWAITQIGIVGTCLVLLFVIFGAPDLALTQLLVEIFTLTIFMFALHRLPRLKYFSSVRSRVRDLVISLMFGGVMGYLTYFSFSHNLDKSVASFYAENAFLKAQGRNIVNVILVDFRSFDTLGEISVVLMAAIGVYILMRKRGQRA